MTQEFIADEGKDRVHSANIIAVKEGASPRTLSSAPTTTPSPAAAALCDNASGVGVLLEMAGGLAQVETPYTLVFVAFGAEEAGLLGSLHYLDALIPRSARDTSA